MKSNIIHERSNIPDFDGQESFWTYDKKDIIMRKIIDSPCNNDNAWEELTAVHFHDVHHTLPSAFGDSDNNGGPLNDDNENKPMLKWIDVNSHNVVDKITIDVLDKVVKKSTMEQQQSMMEEMAQKLPEMHLLLKQLAG